MTRRQVIRALTPYGNGALVIYLALNPISLGKDADPMREREILDLHQTATRETMRKLRLTLKIVRKLKQSQCNRSIMRWLTIPRSSLGEVCVLRYIKEHPAHEARRQVTFPPVS